MAKPISPSPAAAEAFFTIGMLKAWEAMRVIAPDTCRPFSKDRRGMILGEGGAMMILEPLEAAQGARRENLCRNLRHGHDFRRAPPDAADRGRPGARHARALCAKRAWRPRKSATSTPTVPARRATIPSRRSAIREVFGAHADKLAVSSTKSMHGHALGAAGALEAIATILALHHGILPPTANFTERDPECDLDYIPNQSRARSASEAALSNSFAFGGLNAVVAFRAYKSLAEAHSANSQLDEDSLRNSGPRSSELISEFAERD